MSYGLGARLKSHSRIEVEVNSNAGQLMGGVFGGMEIRGRDWITPLSLTAKTIRCEVGEIHIDYLGLLSGNITIKNIATGQCDLRLGSEDLGRFFIHPILQPISAKAIGGQAFHWDSRAVTIGMEEGVGVVRLEGNYNGSRYLVKMTPTIDSSSNSSQGGLKVSARRAVEKQQDGREESDEEVRARKEASEAVARGLAIMFSSLCINLQGIELSKPSLSVVPPSGQGDEASLDITMKIRIKSIPPFDMAF